MEDGERLGADGDCPGARGANVGINRVTDAVGPGAGIGGVQPVGTGDRHPTTGAARVDNEAKACLDEIALSLNSNSDARLAVVGNASSEEKAGNKIAAERAVNTKAYLVTEKGIDPSRISVYTRSQEGKAVSSTLIPAGATLDSSGDTPVDESAVGAHPSRRKSK